jgi:hypothetical protein
VAEAEQAQIDRGLPLFELARVLVRLDHIASVIVNANHGIVWAAVEFRVVDCVPDCIRFAVLKATEWQHLGD